MTYQFRFCVWVLVSLCSGVGLFIQPAAAQDGSPVNGPDPREIPIPIIETPLARLESVTELPVRNEMPDVMVMNDGTKVRTHEQWQKRREELKRILAYYSVGQMPPPPGNVKGMEVHSETVLDDKVTYRLVRLTFGPEEKLSLNIGIFIPTGGWAGSGGNFAKWYAAGGDRAAPPAVGSKSGPRRECAPSGRVRAAYRESGS